MTVGERIKQKRESLEMSQETLASKMGLKDKSSITKIEKGSPSLNTVKRVAQAFGCSVEYLMGWESKRSVPVLGRVAAGIPIEAIEDIIDYEDIGERLGNVNELFGLQIKGDSMTPRICDGDIVIVHKQSNAENGATVIATVNGEDAVCKKFYTYGDTILLRSNNPAYEDINVTGREDFRIVGVVVELRGRM